MRGATLAATVAVAALCASECHGAAHLDPAKAQHAEPLHLQQMAADGDRNGDAAAELLREPGWDYTPNSRLQAPLTAINGGQTVPKGLCDTVESVAGVWLGFFPAGSGKEYFYWVFESRRDPKNDPVILWMTGGPGCSSQVALFKEHGPCTINADRKTTTPNPFSWNAKASIIYIDQPSSVGFSRGPGDETGEWDVAPQMYDFLQSFFEANEYLRDNDFYVFGESYGGHYVPAVSWYVNNQNKILQQGKLHINLKGLGIGNGLTDPKIQYAQFPEFAYNNTYHPVVSKFTYGIMKMATPACTSLIGQCEGGKSAMCILAAQTCNVAMMLPIQLQGLNQYDIRQKCEKPPLCYNFDDVGDFLNQKHVRTALGVTDNDRKWQECNMLVNLAFLTDFMRSYAQNVTELLHDDLRVLIYAGQADYICNWYGNRAWTLNLPWQGKEGFGAAGEHPWAVNGKDAGIARSYGGLTFVAIKDAGHMVPHDQPEAAQVLLNTFLEKQSYY